LTSGSATGDDCWDPADRMLIRLSDALHRDCDVPDDLWSQLTEEFTDEAIIELLMLAGTYRMISYLVRGLRLPLEPGSPRFP
jgi:alkylhydroperoxidase family enzyme